MVSDFTRIGRIADPVHRYIEFTPLEKAILDHPVAQRLRYIAQSGLAHLVFPEVRTSRFSHCLGSMHLASRFLRAILENSSEEMRNLLLSALEAAAVEASGGAGSICPEAVKRPIRQGAACSLAAASPE